MKRLLLFSFIFYLFSFSFAQTSKMSVDGKPQKSSDEIVGKRDVNGKFCAAVQVVSDMDGFKYQSYNGVVEVDDQPGRDMVYLSPNERVLEIFKSGFEPLKIILSEYGIQLKERDVWQIKIKGETKINDFLLVTVFSKPKDAHISIDDNAVSIGKPIELSRGKHILKINKEGFRKVDKKIMVSEENIVFNEILSEIELQKVLIKSTPNEAHIYINNEEKGLTDGGFFLYPGGYYLKLIKAGYLEINKTINVIEGANNTFSYNLDKNRGYLKLDISPSGTNVFINKEDYSNLSNIELAPGRYKIELSKKGYKPETETVLINRGISLKKTFVLTPKTGILQFTIRPISANVVLKRNDQTIQSWIGINYIKDLQVGEYHIECTYSKYPPLKHTFKIMEEQITKIDLSMNKGYSTDSGFVFNGSRYFLTNEKYVGLGSYSNAIKQKYGNSVRIVDWSEIKELFKNNIVAFLDGIKLKYGASALVTKDGEEKYESDRAYFITRHEGKKPWSYLAHDNIQHKYLCLGSWRATLPVLVKMSIK